MSENEKVREVFRVASELYQQGPDWVTFFREVLGLDGLIRQAYPTPEALFAFEQTPEYMEIQAMLSRLRDQGDLGHSPKEPTRVITVRLPKSLHESLRAEAHDRHTSMNQLCISKLLKILENEIIAAGETRSREHAGDGRILKEETEVGAGR